MSVIDIRTGDTSLPTKILFAEPADNIERCDIVCNVNVSDLHPKFIFIEAANGDYVAVRKDDVNNLVMALDKAKQLWCN